MTSPQARIPRLSADEARAATEVAGIPAYMGDLSVFQVLLRHPALARLLNDLIALLIFKGKLDARLRELVIMRIGWRSHAVYEWTQHWRVAVGLGISEDDLVAVRDDWRSYAGFGEAERAVLAAVDETFESGTITDATWKACERATPGPEALLELVVAIGNWRMFATLLRSLAIPLEDGVDPWPPDGRAPA